MLHILNVEIIWIRGVVQIGVELGKIERNLVIIRSVMRIMRADLAALILPAAALFARSGLFRVLLMFLLWLTLFLFGQFAGVDLLGPLGARLIVTLALDLHLHLKFLYWFLPYNSAKSVHF